MQNTVLEIIKKNPRMEGELYLMVGVPMINDFVSLIISQKTTWLLHHTFAGVNIMIREKFKDYEF